MGFVPTSPRRRSTYDGDRRRINADLARLQRRRSQPPVKKPLVRLQAAPSDGWPSGTAWLKQTGI